MKQYPTCLVAVNAMEKISMAISSGTIEEFFHLVKLSRIVLDFVKSEHSPNCPIHGGTKE